MTKTLKNIFFVFCSALAFLLAGVFFVGCGKDYSKVKLVSDTSSVEIEVGQRVDLVFTLNNFQKGFSDEIQINTRSNGQAEVFSTVSTSKLSGHRTRVTIEGKAGGSGQISAVTAQGGLECTIDVFVKQYSQSMSTNNSLFYVSQSTPFEPDTGIFTFDPNTNMTDVSYYYIDNKYGSDADLKRYNRVTDFVDDENGASANFSDGSAQVSLSLLPFDRIILDENDVLKRVFDGEESELPSGTNFNFLAVYDHSKMSEEAGLVYAIDQVDVLSDLNVSVSGQYLVTDEFGNPKLANVQFEDSDDGSKQLVDEGFEDGVSSVTLVPNNKNKSAYVLRVVSDNPSSAVDQKLSFSKGYDQNVAIDFVSREDLGLPVEETDLNVSYIRITHKSQEQCETQLAVNVFYRSFEDVDDESVNKKVLIDVKTQIAPKAILVNGTSEEQKVTLYTNNRNGLGWTNLNVDVISNSNVSPNFEGVLVEYDSTFVKMEHSGTTVSATLPYSDLDVPFRVQGVSLTQNVDITFKVQSDILESGDFLETVVHCEVIVGATVLGCDLSGQDVFTLDVAGGTQNFSHLFANDVFKTMSVSLISGTDVVAFDVGDVYQNDEGSETRFYCEISATPIRASTERGIYRFMLDNGVSLDLTFSCINVLKEETTFMRLASEGKSDVTQFELFSSNGDDFEDSMDIEVLNSSVDGGSEAVIEVVSAFPDGLTLTNQTSTLYVSAKVNQNKVEFVTHGNGYTQFTLRLSGLQILFDDDGNSTFQTVEKSFYLSVNMSTYTLVENLYLVNTEGNSAFLNTVFVGGEGNNSQRSVSFRSKVEDVSATNFFQKVFVPDFARVLFEDTVEIDGNIPFEISTTDESTYVQQVLNKTTQNATYDDKYLYFTAYSQRRNQRGTISRSIIRTFTTVTVLDLQSEGQDSEKTVQIVFDSGIMFYANDLTSPDGRYLVEFSNVFQLIGGYGEFDLNTLTFNSYATQPFTIILNTKLSQRHSTKQFEATIVGESYISAQYISMQSNISALDFTIQDLTETFVVSVNPTNATNPQIICQFDTTNGNTYEDMIETNVQAVGNGVFYVTVSCERFYQRMSSQISSLPSLTGTLFVFPSDWGSSVSSITSGHNPISLNVQLRCGSKENPFLLSNANDLAQINSSEQTLASHYEINSIIDLSGVSNFTPIGVLDGKVVGFSGSIVGTSSQAEIRGVNIANDSFIFNDEAALYGGLFAQLNAQSEIENLIVSGSVKLSDITKTAYVGMLAGLNYGTTTNVGAIFDEESGSKSSITFGAAGMSLYFGGLVGVNNGVIVQNFRKYDGTGYFLRKFVQDENVDEADVLENVELDGIMRDVLTRKVALIREDDLLGYVVDFEGQTLRLKKVGDSYFAVDENEKYVKFNGDGSLVRTNQDFEGQVSKNLAYFNKDVNIVVENGATVYAGGVAGATLGSIERILPASVDFKLFNYTPYSAYARLIFSGTGAIFAGGAVGVAGFAESFVPNPARVVLQNNTNNISNLLTGGELNLLALNSNSTSYVGGVVGYANATIVDTTQEKEVNISNNISRTFVRGNEYVGGIVGYAYYNITTNMAVVKFDGVNKIESVDDKRSTFYSAAIIRKSIVNGVHADVTSLSGDELERFFAIGNYLGDGELPQNVKEYFDTHEFAFESLSYLQREKRTYSGKIYPSSDATYSGTYGDVLVADGNLQEGFVISNVWDFKKGSVDLGEAKDDFLMTSLNGDSDLNVFFMFYFDVTSDIDGNLGLAARDRVVALNTIHTTQTDLYPFSFTNNEISVTTSPNSNVLVDLNGTLTVLKPGLTSITISSVLNANVSKQIYLYVVNFFDAKIDASIFYTTSNLEGVQMNGGSVPIYGNSFTHLYVVPTYEFASTASDGNPFAISSDGVLSYGGMNYRMAKNDDVTIDVFQPDLYVKHEASEIQKDDENNSYYVEKEDGERIVVDEQGYELDEKGNRVTNEEKYFSIFSLNKQDLTFSRNRLQNVQDDLSDTYVLTPILKIVVEGHEFYFALRNSQITITVEYRERAESISVEKTLESIATNGYLKNSVTIKSSNENELLFYDIVRKDEENAPIQTRVPSEVGTYIIDNELVEYEEWLNHCDFDKDLFVLNFERDEKDSNKFIFTMRVNLGCEAYRQRYENSIFGKYTVRFYTSERYDGIYCTMDVDVCDAVLTNVDVDNYSNINDISRTDSLIVPSQRGVLRITLDPLDTVFDRIYISNNAINSLAGAGKAMFTFVTLEGGELESQHFVERPIFGSVDSQGVFSFSYSELLELYANLGLTFDEQIYVSYYLPPTNVDDSVPMAFDVRVVTQTSDDYYVSKPLTTKLVNYARFVFDDKDPLGGAFYVARGLRYGLSLESFGYDESQVTWSVDDNHISIERVGEGRYELVVSDDDLSYDEGKNGYEVNVKVSANKIVDNRPMPYDEDMKLFIMEYVLNYAYADGVSEDIVAGMQDGVITTAVGNPVALALSLQPFMEFDPENSDVVTKVDNFVRAMSQTAEWNVYESDIPTRLERGKSFTSPSEYYRVSSFVVTPLRIYTPNMNIYHFTVETHYSMNKGEYFATTISQGTDVLFTDFAFNVHNQSTRESPIPVRNIGEFLAMEENEWYILLDNITLPSVEYVEQHSSEGLSQFMPIQTQIAGLDGNGWKIYMGGTYNFDDTIQSVGVFGSLAENSILQNVSVVFNSDVIISMNSETFSVGMLVADNYGILTNCSVSSMQNYSLSVIHSTSTNNAVVAGVVANNNGSGTITNSRSSVKIFTNVDVAGFVANNNGHIASSFYRDSSIINSTNGSEATAGFVINNSGDIFTSYVSGARDGDADGVYYKYDDADLYDEDIVSSRGNVTGFVYTNDGGIYDCYSNISIMQSGGESSGFVFTNTGRIERCFSTSVLEGERTSNYGFVNFNTLDENEDGGIFDCFYLSDSEANEGAGVNVGLGDREGNSEADVRTLKVDDFKDLSNFANFVVAKGRDIHSVWFFDDGANSSTENFNGVKFNTKRIELVAANMIVNPQRTLYSVDEVEGDDGVTYYRYSYEFDESCPLGSAENPILISSAENFENYILQENNSVNINNSYYRLICDIDYEDYLFNSATYVTRFNGYFEGNFMEIRGQKFISSSKMGYAGMFAEISNTSTFNDAGATVMNFTYRPKIVDFANAQIVGAVAGRVNGGNVFNINLMTDERNIIMGNNIAGGVVGLAIGNYKFQNLYSQFGAKARNHVILDDSFNFEIGDLGNLSMAGSIVGVLSGTGTIYNCVTDSVLTVVGHRAGLMFGYVDEGVTVSKVNLSLDNEMELNGYSSYAGLIVGESRGVFNDVTISKNSDTPFTNFLQEIDVPNAIGGFAGLISGGQVNGITVDVVILESKDSTDNSAESLGAVAGIISGSVSISDVIVNANLTGYSNVGGVAGLISSEEASVVSFTNVNVTANLNAYGTKQSTICVGGLAGKVDSNVVIDLTADATADQTLINNLQNTTNSLATAQSELEVLQGELGELQSNAPQNRDEIARKQEDIRQKQSDIDELTANLATYQAQWEGESNNFVVNAQVHTYSYSANNAVVSIGSIIGNNASYSSHNICDSRSSLEGSVLLRNMSTVRNLVAILETDEEGTFNCHGEGDAGVGTLATYFSIIRNLSTRCTFECKGVRYDYSENCGRLTINCFG